MFETPDDGDAPVPTYEHQVKCPNARNLIAIIGDSLSDPDRVCDQKCNLQMEGMGRKPSDVQIEGDRLKKDVIRADRADGFFLRNVVGRAGRVQRRRRRRDQRLPPAQARHARTAQNYGVLTFTSDNGLYDHIEAYGNGDSGIYPGSGPEGHCQRYGIEIRNVNSHDNVLGYSGTAGNGTWTHNSKFHDNNAGISDDSFASGHPGMPQDCSKWTANQVYSNNRELLHGRPRAYCKTTPFEKRREEIVCPQFQVPVGSGFILYGVNENIVQNNAIYDNWRSGVRLFWVPAAIRGENDPAKQSDTSNGNRFIANQMGIGPGGARRPTASTSSGTSRASATAGSGNVAPGGKITSDPAHAAAAARSGSLFQQSPNPAKPRAEAPVRLVGPETTSRTRPAAPGSRRRPSRAQ